MHRRAFLISAPMLGLAACSGEAIWDPDDAVQRAFVAGTGDPSLTLYTMKNVGSDNGAHSSVLVNASQRVMWDPAGTFRASVIPERNDVLFGFTQRVEDFYVSFHARETFYVVGQEISVAPDVAEKALRLVMSHGAVPKANCTRATSGILRELRGFESLPRTWFPDNLEDAFATLPGVVTTVYRENDADDKTTVAADIDKAIRTGQ